MSECIRAASARDLCIGREHHLPTKLLGLFPQVHYTQYVEVLSDCGERHLVLVGES